MSTSQDLATWLRERLPEFPPGRLPSVRSLAARFGAGTRTVQEGLELLKREGLIESRSRSGYWRAGQLPDLEPPEARQGSHDFAARLAEEIRTGKHPWDVPLPSSKEQARIWGCHPQTAAKVFGVLCAQGLLQRRGRQHVPVRPKTARRVEGPTILCLGAPAADGGIRIDTDRELDFWRDLGSLAAEAGLSLQREPWRPGMAISSKRVVGVVASAWHHHDPLALCRDLERIRLPVCVWIEEHTIQSKFRRSSRLRFHEQGYSAEIGSHLARHLFDLGHQHLAYISPWHSSQWSRNRLRGIQEEAARRGGKVSVRVLEGESDWDHLAPAREDAALNAKFPRELLEELVEGDASLLHEGSILELAWNRILRDTIPLLEGALADGATAWIGANDRCALQIHGWLASRGIRVPQDISLAGFDDTAGALRADLTSFRFASADMARAMIRQILSHRGMSSTLTRHEGVVVGRGSTGAGRQAL
jgi:DNA-binding LacI/PurR family transcriptional regulator/DNA-binding transcriptional regulator YhcF (GntR family)